MTSLALEASQFYNKALYPIVSYCVLLSFIEASSFYVWCLEANGAEASEPPLPPPVSVLIRRGQEENAFPLFPFISHCFFPIISMNVSSFISFTFNFAVFLKSLTSTCLTFASFCYSMLWHVIACYSYRMH